jgi:hypothetical protein
LDFYERWFGVGNSILMRGARRNTKIYVENDDLKAIANRGVTVVVSANVVWISRRGLSGSAM